MQRLLLVENKFTHTLALVVVGILESFNLKQTIVHKKTHFFSFAMKRHQICHIMGFERINVRIIFWKFYQKI
jgi:hypothetical protein